MYGMNQTAITWLLAIVLLLPGTRADSNGWEHGAVPFEVLVKALEDDTPEMRRRAAESLGLRGQLEAIDPLLTSLARGEENPHVRSALYLALGRLGDHRSVTVLIKCLKKEIREELRSDCVTALGMIGVTDTLPHLVKALDKDTAVLVQISVVEALGNFSAPMAVETLAALTTDAANHTMRQRALRALGRTGAPTAATPLLQALAGAGSDRERLVIVKALTQLRPQAATAPLTTLLHKTAEPQLRTHIAIALGAIRDGDAYPTLIALLTDPVASVRYFAIRSLKELGRREAIVPIGALSQEIFQRLTHRSLQDMLDNPVPVLADLSLQVVALQTIAELDAKNGLQALTQAAQPRPLPRDSAVALKIAEGFYRQRRAALNGLGATRTREAAAVLAGQGGLQDPDFRLRAVAVQALGRLGFSDLADKVRVALNDPAAEVRWTAAAVLGRMDNPQAVEPLMARLTDSHAEVRRQAALSLGYLDARSASEALLRLRRDDDNAAVREAAAYSLRLIAK